MCIRDSDGAERRQRRTDRARILAAAQRQSMSSLETGGARARARSGARCPVRASASDLALVRQDALVVRERCLNARNARLLCLVAAARKNCHEEQCTDDP